MRADLVEALREADVPLIPGMQTDCGRVLQVGEGTVLVWDGELREVDGEIPLPDLEDAPTFLACLAFLCSRTGLDPSTGVLWYRSGDEGDDAWVLEGTDETRTRDGDTDDPLLALARALLETV